MLLSQGAFQDRRRLRQGFLAAFSVAALACAATTGCSIEIPVSSSQDHRLASADPGQVPTPDPYLNAPPDLGSKPLADRMAIANLAAASRGADFAVVYRDRSKNNGAGETVSNGDAATKLRAQISSLTKLWIADHLLYQDAADQRKASDDTTKFRLTDDEKRNGGDIDKMISDSDDAAAWRLWTKYGGNIVGEIKGRYKLSDDTATSPDGTWWSVVSTPGDIVNYYDQLLAHRNPQIPDSASDDDKNTAAAWQTAAQRVVNDLLNYNSTQTSSCYGSSKSDKQQCGYDQTFGVHKALPQERLEGTHQFGVKQARMCCVDGNWIHWSTAIAGPDESKIVVALSIEKIAPSGSSVNEQRFASTQVADDDSAKRARVTLTGSLIRVFPDGKLPDLS